MSRFSFSRRHMQVVSCLICMMMLSTCAMASDPPSLISVRKIGDTAPHNAFTDMVRYNDQFYVVYREGAGHVSSDGALHVIRSHDGTTWETASRITATDADLREAKFLVNSNGSLSLIGAAALHDTSSGVTHQTRLWNSPDGTNWSASQDIGDPNIWLWRTVWHNDTAYGVGYHFNGDTFTRLYTSTDGVNFAPYLDRLYDAGHPNEAGIAFLDDGRMVVLLRNEYPSPRSSQIGVSSGNFLQWTWSDTGVQIGGPDLYVLPDGRIIAATRLYDGPVHRTALSWLDIEDGTLTEFLTLPSGGDTSYPGMLYEDGTLWVSYYSTHEGSTNVYMAKVDIAVVPEPTSALLLGGLAAAGASAWLGRRQIRAQKKSTSCE